MKNTYTTKTFADRLSDLINDDKKKTGHTIRQLGELCGVPSANLSKYQNDEAEASITTVAKIANFFNVSVDYLLGLSNVKSANVKVKAICDYTGLSDGAVDVLTFLKSESADSVYLINQIIETFTAEIDYELEQSYSVKTTSLLSALINYFASDFLNNTEKLNITLSGKVKDCNSTDREYCRNNFTAYQDLISFEEINSGEIVEQVLVNKIVECLKEAKKNIESPYSNRQRSYCSDESEQIDYDLPF